VTRDYKDTLRLPKTDFPMKANLAQREKEFLSFWQERGIYQKMQEIRDGSPTFILHDGPPYANGHIHIGTAFNKILKDFIPKFKSMRGFRAPYVPGWDTHGLPIELKVLKEDKVDREQVSPLELRSRCAKYALGFVDVQREEFKRLGVLGDWDDPYLTLKPEYEAAQVEAFADMLERGLVYKGKKPVFWCTDCQTALAAAEIEYEDESSPSIYVAYPMESLPSGVSLEGGLQDLYVVIWTTTPWTLPASMAVALHPQYKYGVFRARDGRRFIVALERREEFEGDVHLGLGEMEAVFTGEQLEGAMAVHPFYQDRKIPLVLADYVVLDSGTGCVHTAPGHGVEDFETGVRYGLEILNPVDNRGVFLKDVPLVGGLPISDGAKVILEILTESRRLLSSGEIKHSYPHCWRCKQPVIFRATEQWFVSVQAFRDQAMDAIDTVQWVPSWGKDRIGNMVRDRSDWCISRQRVWGVPIPAFYCQDCGKLVAEPAMVRRVAQVIRSEGSDAWWARSPMELLGDLCSCPHCGSSNLSKESDIMDVWFDSGVSHLAVLETRKELGWPADMYLEGSDQHRGWFQTSLLTGIATRGKAPFQQVLTHGFIVDGKGRKMSKSLGNVVSPQEVIDKYGADILRLWVASTDYRGDVRISDRILKNLVESYRRIRNTARFILGNLSDFDPAKHRIPRTEMLPFDKWAVSRLQDLIEKVTRGYEEYEFHVPYFAVHQFCDNDMSSLYLDVCKDRLYADHQDGISRRSAQSAMWEILISLCKILSPILSFTCEEIWHFARGLDRSLEESVFLSDWPVADRTGLEDVDGKAWDRLFSVRGAVLRALEQARLADMIGNSLEAQVELDLKTYGDLKDLFPRELMEDLFMVSDLILAPLSEDAFQDQETGVAVKVSHSPHQKCPRCWKWKEEVGRLEVCGRCKEVLDRLG
jgi:isoleucyl-tRNA synthetase